MSYHCIQCRADLDRSAKACPSCGERISAFVREFFGNRIDGKYELIERVGEGGMGEVFKVLHVDLQLERALKVIRPELATNEIAAARFKNEARVAAQVSSDYVADFYDLLTLPDGTLAVVTEFVDGPTLHKKLSEARKLRPAEAIRLIDGVLAGLESIHDRGILHRDLSPQNIILRRKDNRPIIIDFGIAKDLDQPGLTSTGMFVGKWEYAAPEQMGIFGPPRLDQRSDLFSAGIVFYEMLVGRKPYEARSFEEISRCYYQGLDAALPPNWLSDDNLRAYATKAISIRPESRFASASEMRAALRILDQDSDAPSPDVVQILDEVKPVQPPEVVARAEGQPGGTVQIAAPQVPATPARQAIAPRTMVRALAVVGLLVGIAVIIRMLATAPSPDQLKPRRIPPREVPPAVQPTTTAPAIQFQSLPFRALAVDDNALNATRGTYPLVDALLADTPTAYHESLIRTFFRETDANLVIRRTNDSPLFIDDELDATRYVASSGQPIHSRPLRIALLDQAILGLRSTKAGELSAAVRQAESERDSGVGVRQQRLQQLMSTPEVVVEQHEMSFGIRIPESHMIPNRGIPAAQKELEDFTASSNAKVQAAITARDHFLPEAIHRIAVEQHLDVLLSPNDTSILFANSELNITNASIRNMDGIDAQQNDFNFGPLTFAVVDFAGLQEMLRASGKELSMEEIRKRSRDQLAQIASANRIAIVFDRHSPTIVWSDSSADLTKFLLEPMKEAIR